MARTQLKVFTLLFLCLLASANEQLPAKPVEKQVDAVVEGMVYCQSSACCGTWSLTGANPISNSTISVICKDYKKRVSFYKAFKTDEHGYFYAELKGFKMGHFLLDHPLHSCHVILVSSPQKDCNLLSNVNYGLNGAPLRYEDKRLVGRQYEAVVYTAGPLAFRPTHCNPN